LIAQAYIERVGVPAELARCWANTGMALTQISRESEGYDLLIKALRLQHAIGDALGERITQHNLDQIQLP